MRLHDEYPDRVPARSTDRDDAGAVDATRLPSGASREVHLLKLQRLAGNAAVQQLREDDPHGIHQVTAGGGSPLDRPTLAQMEPALGADLSDVRVHTGGDADRSARSLGAHAYTVGSDVVFAEGRYDPGSQGGLRTLAHELTHVVQQRSGPVDGEMTDSGVRVSDPSDRFEQAAEAMADRVVSGQASPVGATAGGGVSAVQRQPEEEDVQPLADHVQREEVDDVDEADSA